jgi:hypothetical protein
MGVNPLLFLIFALLFIAGSVLGQASALFWLLA